MLQWLCLSYVPYSGRVGKDSWDVFIHVSVHNLNKTENADVLAYCFMSFFGIRLKPAGSTGHVHYIPWNMQKIVLCFVVGLSSVSYWTRVIHLYIFCGVASLSLGPVCSLQWPWSNHERHGYTDWNKTTIKYDKWEAAICAVLVVTAWFICHTLLASGRQ